MKIAFLHYHLKTGGVTTCLKQQIEALRNDCKMLVFTGELPETPFPAEIFHVPELAYSTQYTQSFASKKVADTIFKAIQAKFKGPCDILHIHNPILAKNKKFLKILKALQTRKIPLFLQIHDFAEDGRPMSYFAEDYVADCHYGVLNSRDYRILLKAGLGKDGLHQLFNTINPFLSRQVVKNRKSYIVYPIRALRRKNIGEAILLSLFFSNRETLVITLPPNSPMDIESYLGWKTFVSDQHLNIEFDKGLSHNFEALVHSARYLITTSITEGFGFSFLEPWLFEKLVWGRKLPEICSDFETNGICLDHMYTKLMVPLDWIGHREFYQKWAAAIQRSGMVLNFKLNKKRILHSFESLTADGNIDFGLLDEYFQKLVISKVVSSKISAANLVKLNEFLTEPAKVADEKKLIENNRKAVNANYNLNVYRQKLLEIYRTVGQREVKQRIDKKILLAEFFDLNTFSLLKWGDYGE